MFNPKDDRERRLSGGTVVQTVKKQWFGRPLRQPQFLAADSDAERGYQGPHFLNPDVVSAVT